MIASAPEQATMPDSRSSREADRSLSARPGALNWLVFGEDWAGHPSTTQHLVRNLPDKDRVVWVDSIGMRTPKLRAEDLLRLATKGLGLLGRGRGPQQQAGRSVNAGFAHLRPAIIPWHGSQLARRLNRRLLSRAVSARQSAIEMASSPIVLTSNPLLIHYLPALPRQRLIYLRLDKYEDLPGVERDLVLEAEPLMFAAADVVVATARELLPKDAAIRDKGHYLPQGVDTAHFAGVPDEPPATRVLGFCGLLAEWVDFDLILSVAQRLPDWQLEFVGPVRCVPEAIRAQANIRLLPPVDFARLPEAMAHWTAAWVPFEVSELTAAVNPLKIREYLAAGLPSHCTPMPEVVALANEADVLITERPEKIVEWLTGPVLADSAVARRGRKSSMTSHSWAERCRRLRGLAAGTSAGRVI